MNSLASLRAAIGFDRATVRKALVLALAAWLSFSIAALLHVDNAYWAAMPVWVIIQPSRGLLMERAAFRIVGTLIGAAVGFVLMHIPAAPTIVLAMLAMWIALNAGLTHVLRGGHGYGALLAGMTAAIVIIPSLLAPAGSIESLDIAVARVECTLIGVIVSTFVLSLPTPDSSLAEFYAQVRAVSAQAVAYAARILRGGVSAGDGSEERRILDLICKLDASARLNAAGSLTRYRRLGTVDLLVVGSLSTMAAAQAARDLARCDARLPAWLERVAAHLRGEWAGLPADEERRIETAGDPALMRLKLAVGQILDADAALHAANTVQAQLPSTKRIWLAPHREWSLAVRTGAMAGAASFIGSALALWLDWPPMTLAALGVCIFVMVLGSLPQPQLVAPKLLAGVMAGVVAAIFYRLAVQPVIATTAELLLTLAPFLLLGGFARAHPRTGAAGIDSNMCFLLASQAGMPAVDDIGRIFSDAIALALAAGVVAGGFVLLPRRAQRQAIDAAATIRRDLQRIVESDAGGSQAVWRARSARQILRLSLHLGRAKELGERWPKGLLATLNLGQAMIDLQQLGMPDAVKAPLAALLRQKASPQRASDALRASADATDDDQLRRAIARLADTVVQAADLLTFGLPPDSRGRKAFDRRGHHV